jgi:hypothetical protein
MSVPRARPALAGHARRSPTPDSVKKVLTISEPASQWSALRMQIWTRVASPLEHLKLTVPEIRPPSEITPMYRT